MIFASLDDKAECVGVYTEGKLYFTDFPDDLSHTWRYAGWHSGGPLEYGWLYCEGKSLEEVAPDALQESFKGAQKKLLACMKALHIAKINLREHCFFDLVPLDFLLEFNNLKNQIMEYVFEKYERPLNYDHLSTVHRLLYKLRQRPLNLSTEGCKELLYASAGRAFVQKYLNRAAHIDYNLFGTVTGRLATQADSFPILTMKKEYRKLIKPCNDWFLSLDYNGAEIRTILDLAGSEQPSADIHEWNMEHVFADTKMSRDEAKTIFFAWLYNPDSTAIQTECYDRRQLLETWYKEGHIQTPYGRSIKVEERKAFNYLIQSTTADRVLEKAVKIDELLAGRNSCISHIVHDEIVLDFADEDREILGSIKDVFEDGFKANIKAGKNYFDLEDLRI